MFQKNIWDKLWSEKANIAEWDNGAQIVYEVLVKEIGDLKGKKILEAGSGTGRISLRLGAEGGNVTLVDFSEIAIEQAKRRFEMFGVEGNFIVSDIMDMSMIPTDSYDVVWNGGVLEHFDLQQQISTLNEMRRILKPGGILITLNPNANCMTYQVGKWYMEKTEKWFYGRELPIYTLKEACLKAELNIINEYSVGFKESLYFLSHLPNSTYVKHAFEKWFDSLPDKKQDVVDGYLLATICKKDAEVEDVKNNNDYVLLREIEKDKDTIIILSSVHYRKDLWQRPQQLAVHFRKLGYRVVYVNNRTSSLDMGNIENEEVRKNLYNLLFLQALEDEGVVVLDRLEYLVNGTGNKLIVKDEYLKALVSFFSGKKTRVITYLAQNANVLEDIKNTNREIEIYFDCVDDITGFEGRKIIPSENKLLEFADGVIVTSKTLYVHKSKMNRKTILIPNAVNPEEFMGGYKRPLELSNMKGPIIGYVGAVARWFDQDLVCELAKNNPTWNIVLVGTIYTDVSKMRKFSNIHLLGRKEYKEIPSFMKSFDVGIIPFVMNDLIINTNPIKFFEYLAAGINTVATPMPELINEPYCFLAKNANEFSAKINMILKDKKIQDCTEFLNDNSWKKRATEIVQFMEGIKEFNQNRDKKLTEIVKGYERFSDMSLLNLLRAEILNELNKKKEAIEMIENNLANVVDLSPTIQLRLALEWREWDYLLLIIRKSQGIKGLNDALYWKGKGVKYLEAHVYRLLGEYDKSIDIINEEVNKDKDILEEMANVYFESDRLVDAKVVYEDIFKRHNHFKTLTAAIYYTNLLMSIDEKTLIDERITNPFKEYLNNIASDCIGQFMERNFEESILLGEEFLGNGDANNDISSEIHALIGLSYENLGMSALALKHAELALQFSSIHEEALELYKRLTN